MQRAFRYGRKKGMGEPKGHIMRVKGSQMSANVPPEKAENNGSALYLSQAARGPTYRRGWFRKTQRSR